MSELHFRRWQSTFNVCMLFGILLIIFIAGALLFERPWLRYVHRPFGTGKPSYRAGEVVDLLVERCSSEDGRQMYARVAQLVRVDAEQAPEPLGSGEVLIEPGCHVGVSTVNVIPIGTPPGRYYIDGVAKIDGTVRTFLVKFESQPFNVTP